MLWEESNLTDQLTNLLKNVGKDNFDTITEIKNVLTKNGVTDTTVQKKPGIYLIVNKVNGKYYVGSSCNVKRRVYEHFYYLENSVHNNPKLQAAFNLHGKNNFETIMLESLDGFSMEDILPIEQKYLTICNSVKYNNYNCRYLSTGGNRPTVSFMEKLSLPRGPLKESTKEKLRIRFSGENNPNFGKRHTQEWKDNMSKIKKNISEETREKMRAAARRRVRRKMGPMSDETKQKLRLAALKRWDKLPVELPVADRHVEAPIVPTIIHTKLLL